LILAGLACDLIIILLIRADLVFDMIFSGLAMGFLYIFIYLINFATFPGNQAKFWFTDDLIGVNFLSIPIEEIVVIFLFGALFGPLYAAIKDLREK